MPQNIVTFHTFPDHVNTQKYEKLNKNNVDLVTSPLLLLGVDPITLLGFEGKSVLNEFYNIPVDQLFTSLIAGPETLYEKVLEANGSTGMSS